MVVRMGRAVVRAHPQVALLPPAAFAVHQLRYLLAYGGAVGGELQRTGHSYLHSVVPWLVAFIALAAGRFLRALGRACSGQRSAGRFTVSLAGLWLACSAALVAIFVGQELLEGWFASGHPAGLTGIFGYGGWWAIPAAACVGLVLAAAFHGARWIVDEVARRFASLPRPQYRIGAQRVPLGAVVLWPAPLLAGWSNRGPPT